MTYAPSRHPLADQDLKVQFACGGIRHVNVLDYIASRRQTGLTRLLAARLTQHRVALRGWVMPKAGAAFVWVLEEEIARSYEMARRGMNKTVI